MLLLKITFNLWHTSETSDTQHFICLENKYRIFVHMHMTHSLRRTYCQYCDLPSLHRENEEEHLHSADVVTDDKSKLIETEEKIKCKS